jgi:sugar O-acyltransferase (sialic acid O-acetyltransferase NeuD family)
MKAILLIGGGGHCRACIDVIEAEGRFLIKGILQPRSDGVDPVLGYPILGDDADLPALLAGNMHALVTVGQIGTHAVRKRLFELLKTLKAVVPSIVSPRAYVSSHSRVEEGVLIMHGSVVNAGAKVGANTIINSLALIEHDAQIGKHCHISTGAIANGNVVVEDGCFIGSGAVLHQGVRIGANSIIGAGSVVTHDVSPNSLLKARRCK